MNKQRKVLITTTYNEMGIIIDTKTEELGSSAQLGTDTISRQAAIEACYQEHDASYSTLEAKGAAWRCAVNIKNLPSVQPEIIRCKDCRHSEYDAMYGDRYCHHNGKADIVPDNHYCGYSERRTDGTD